ncbi:T9SS type A sorting domain-containing protein [Elusimicrobiota bacterium]
MISSSVIASLRRSNLKFIASLGLPRRFTPRNDKMSVCLLGFLFLLSPAPPIFADTTVSLDTSFGDTYMSTRKGYDQYSYSNNLYADDNDIGYAVHIDTDGRILVAGSADRDKGSAVNLDMALWRYNNDGTLDANFNRLSQDAGTLFYGAAGKPDEGFDLTIDNTGAILVTGYTTYTDPDEISYTRMTTWKYKYDGNLDPDFGTNGIVFDDNANGQGNKIMLDSGGNILITGKIGTSMALWRFEPDGDPDTDFGPNNKHYITWNSEESEGKDFLIDPNNKIIIAGHVFASASTDFDIALWRYDPVRKRFDPDFDLNFDGMVNVGTTGPDYAVALATTSDNMILVGGYATDTTASPANFEIVLWKYNTQTKRSDSNFGTSGGVAWYDNSRGDDKAFSLVIGSDDKILVTGYSDKTLGALANYDMALWRFNSNGTLDMSFDSDGIFTHSNAAGGNDMDSGYAVMIDTVGGVFVAGKSETSKDGAFDMILWRALVPPSIRSISPGNGMNDGSVNVEITGAHFDPANPGTTVSLVKSGETDIAASGITVSSESKISAAFNLNSAITGQWDVKVTNPSGKIGELANGFAVILPTPTITAITPNYAYSDDVVLITNLAGTNFQSPVTVSLAKTGQSDIEATGITVIGQTQISCTLNLRDAETGLWDIQVTRNASWDGQSAALSNGFTINPASPSISGIVPNSGQPNTIVSFTDISGENFSDVTALKLTNGGATVPAASLTVVNDNKITAVINLAGAAAGTWNVVTTESHGLSDTLTNGFTINNQAPTLISISPNNWPQTGSKQVTLTGTNFASGISYVKLTRYGIPDINATAINILSATQLTAILDLAGAPAGTWDIVIMRTDTLSASLGSGLSAQATIPHEKVKIRGGAKGYVNPRLGENATIILNPSTTGSVSIKIYTIEGELVREINEYISSPGAKSVTWNIKNLEGSTVSSGIYLVYINGAGIHQTKKVAVIK